MHRLSPHQFSAGSQAPDHAQSEAARVYAFRGRELLLTESWEVPTAGQLEAHLGLDNVLSEAIYFGALGHASDEPTQYCFALRVEKSLPLPAGYRAERLRSLYVKDFQPIGLPRRAIGVLDWAREHRFCGACGKPTTLVESDRSRACEPCGLRFYPRMSPAVIVAIHRGDQLLLARGGRHPDGMFSVLAGFVESGESLEECVMREVHEEVGISLSGIEYFGSQSWPHPNALMLGFRAKYAGGDLKVDGEEIVEAGFYPRDGLPPLRPGSYSIAHWLIEDFLRGGSPGTPPRVDFEREALSHLPAGLEALSI